MRQSKVAPERNIYYYIRINPPLLALSVPARSLRGLRGFTDVSVNVNMADARCAKNRKNCSSGTAGLNRST